MVLLRFWFCWSPAGLDLYITSDHRDRNKRLQETLLVYYQVQILQKKFQVDEEEKTETEEEEGDRWRKRSSTGRRWGDGKETTWLTWGSQSRGTVRIWSARLEQISLLRFEMIRSGWLIHVQSLRGWFNVSLKSRINLMKLYRNTQTSAGDT